MDVRVVANICCCCSSIFCIVATAVKTTSCIGVASCGGGALVVSSLSLSLSRKRAGGRDWRAGLPDLAVTFGIAETENSKATGIVQ